MSGRIYPEEQYEHDFETEPDWDDVQSLEQADEDNAPPFYAFEEDEDIYDDEDDICPACGLGYGDCVCGDDGDDDDTDAPLSEVQE